MCCEGAIALAGAVRSEQCPLLRLNLSGNRIKVKGAAEVVKASISEHSKLIYLSLTNNLIRSEGRAELASLAGYNYSNRGQQRFYKRDEFTGPSQGIVYRWPFPQNPFSADRHSWPVPNHWEPLAIRARNATRLKAKKDFVGDRSRALIETNRMMKFDKSTYNYQPLSFADLPPLPREFMAEFGGSNNSGSSSSSKGGKDKGKKGKRRKSPEKKENILSTDEPRYGEGEGDSDSESEEDDGSGSDGSGSGSGSERAGRGYATPVRPWAANSAIPSSSTKKVTFSAVKYVPACVFVCMCACVHVCVCELLLLTPFTPCLSASLPLYLLSPLLHNRYSALQQEAEALQFDAGVGVRGDGVPVGSAFLGLDQGFTDIRSADLGASVGGGVPMGAVGNSGLGQSAEMQIFF